MLNEKEHEEILKWLDRWERWADLEEMYDFSTAWDIHNMAGWAAMIFKEITGELMDNAEFGKTPEENTNVKENK